ncbi:hypothetical protein BH10PAT1_BH10PAT1_4920 [soil metagenome]
MAEFDPSTFHQTVANKEVRDSKGHFTKTSGVSAHIISDETAPLVNFSLNNPWPAIKSWIKKFIGSEAITIRIPFILAIAIIAFGLGGATLRSKIPLINSLFPSPTPAVNIVTSDWTDSALTGTLQVTPNTNKYYLLTSSSVAISLQFDKTVDLNKYIGKRILASGSYNSKTHILIITDVLSLEVLPASPVPIITQTPSPTPTPVPTIEPTEVPSI